MTATLVAVAVIVTAAAATTAAGQILRRRDAAQLDGLADLLLDEMLQLVHLFLRVEEAGGHRVFQERVTFRLEGGDFRRIQRLAAVLFFLERLPLAHQALVGAARGGVRQKSVQALLDAAGLDVFDDGFAQFARFGFNFVGYKLNNWPKINHNHHQKANDKRSY